MYRGFSLKINLTYGPIIGGQVITSLLKEAMNSPCPQDKQKRTWAEVINERLLAMAVEGDLSAMKLIFEYVAGKPKQSEEMQSEVQIKVVYDD